MSLSPQDIVEVELRQAMRGYATGEVDDLLRRVGETLQANDEELAEMRSRLEHAEAKVAEAEAAQRSVQQALVTAHAAAAETIRNAEQQAEEFRQGARRDLDIEADKARREVEGILQEGRAAQQRQREEFETARERLQAAYDAQRSELGERLDVLREQLVVCEGFLRSHIDEQERALDRILGRIEQAGAPDGSEDDDGLPAVDPETRAPDEPQGSDEREALDGPEASDDSTEASGEPASNTDELPRVDVAAALSGSSHAAAESDADHGQDGASSADR
jgi:DivIVA domain-containing protein